MWKVNLLLNLYVAAHGHYGGLYINDSQESDARRDQ
jgi:hypothetical protein